MKKLGFPIGIQCLLGSVHIVPKRGEGNTKLMLIPRKDAQPINYKMYEEFTPRGNKLEMVSGIFLPFNNEKQKMLILCLFNMGLQEFVRILPQESKEELFHLLRQDLKE